MAKRGFRPEDFLRLKTAADPDLSPDGRRVAFVVGEVDQEKDRVGTSIWVAAVDGSAPARRFSDGPADRSPRWSPDGRWLAYLAVTDDKAHRAHVRLASLEGGVPTRLGDLPGPVSQVAWAPHSAEVVVVSRVGVPDPDGVSATERNAGRRVRGLAARLDGVGWQDGRRQLFVVAIADGTARQLTRGEFDHADPSYSPDGSTITFASDRTARRDDRQLRSDAWVIPATGGRPRRLTNGPGRVSFPVFSPDGRHIAFAGQVTDSWDEETHLFVLAADGSGTVEMVTPDTDRGVPVAPGAPAPLCWIGEQELAVLVADRGAICLHRARIGQRRSREIVGGDVQIDGFAVRPGPRAATVAFTSSWPDRPSELYVTRPGGGDPLQLTHLNAEVLDKVELAPVKRRVISRPDGAQVEYFTLLPRGVAPRRLPVHLDIHGGPHGAWPAGRFLGLHQAIAAAGYALVLPNPRGSSSYGQEFTRACTGDWGGADFGDIMACCDDLVAEGVADEARLFVSGASYGGFMTAWAVGHTRRFRAATAVAPVIDQTSMALTTDITEFALFNMGGTPWPRPDEYHKRSPLSYLPDVTTPVLVIHWEGDIRVPVSQGEELYSALRVLGKDAEFVRYPGGFHILRTPSQAVDWAKQILGWNAQHDRHPTRRAARPE